MGAGNVRFHLAVEGRQLLGSPISPGAQPIGRPDQSQASVNAPLPFIAQTETGRIKEAVEGGIIQAGRIIRQNAESFRGHLDGDTAERRMMAVPLG